MQKVGDTILRNKDGVTEEEFLKSYDPNRYEKPCVTTDTLIFTMTEGECESFRTLGDKELRVLLVKRGNHPFMGQWAIPGGFINMDENLEDGAARELKEETNVEDQYLEQLYTYGSVERDPRCRVISTVYMSLMNSECVEIEAGDDAADAAWFTVTWDVINKEREDRKNGYILNSVIRVTLRNKDNVIEGEVLKTKVVEGRRTKISRRVLKSSGIAFDHVDIIYYGLERLKNKIEYTDIAFNLLNPEFTMAELRQVHEVILKKEIKQASINRKYSHMVTGTEKKRRGKGHKPAQLFRFNPEWDDE